MPLSQLVTHTHVLTILSHASVRRPIFGRDYLLPLWQMALTGHDDKVAPKADTAASCQAKRPCPHPTDP